MFYEMLTGELPRGAFDPPSKKAGADERLDHVVTRAMQTEPADRYPSATEMRTEVDEVRTAPDLECADSSALSSGEPRKRTGIGASGRIGSQTQIESGDESPHSKGSAKKALWIAAAFIVVIAAAVVAVVVGDFGKPEGSGAGTVDGGGRKGTPSADPDSIFPLSLPEFPPKRPEGAGRIVFVPINDSPAPPPDCLSEAANQDLTDVVRVSLSPVFEQPDRAYILAIRNDGSVEGYGPDGHAGLNELRRGFSGGAVQASKSIYQLIPVLDDEGFLWFSRPHSNEVPSVRRDDVVMIGQSGSVGIALYKKGEVSVWGGAGSHVERARLMQSIVDGGKFVSVAGTDGGICLALRPDGALIAVADVGSGKSKQMSLPAGSVALLPEKGGVVATPNGGLLRLELAGWKSVPNFPAIDCRAARIVSGYLDRADRASPIAFAVIQANGMILFCSDAIMGKRERDLETAFADALDFGFYGDYVLAVLPADTVSRSGYWEVDDLIADRQQLRESR